MMSQVFFVGDLHLGHRNICKYRPQFDTVKEHDEFVFDSVMSVASKRNKLFMLGDCFFDQDAYFYVKDMMREFRSVEWILGNHDTDRLKLMWNIKRLAHVIPIHSMRKYKEFWLTHAPIHPDELYNKFNIHAHCHNHVINDDRYIGVSLEQTDYKPISLDKVRSKLREIR